MLARLGLDGDCSNATSELSNLARSLAATKEAHHFYPLLFYFRFEDPLYSVSRFSFVLLDLVTLIETALDRAALRSLARSAPVDFAAPVRLAPARDARSQSSDQEGPGRRPRRDLPQQAELRRRDRNARARRLMARSDGMDRYVAERRTWEPLIRRVAPILGYEMDEIDRRQPHNPPVRLPRRA